MLNNIVLLMGTFSLGDFFYDHEFISLGILTVTLIGVIIGGVAIYETVHKNNIVKRIENNPQIQSIQLKDDGSLSISDKSNDEIKSVFKAKATIIDKQFIMIPITTIVNKVPVTTMQYHYYVTLQFGKYTDTIDDDGVYNKNNVGDQIDSVVLYTISQDNSIKVTSIEVPTDKNMKTYEKDGLLELGQNSQNK